MDLEKVNVRDDGGYDDAVVDEMDNEADGHPGDENGSEGSG